MPDDWSEALRRLIERRYGTVAAAARKARRSYQSIHNWTSGGREPGVGHLLDFLELIDADLADLQAEIDAVRRERQLPDAPGVPPWWGRG